MLLDPSGDSSPHGQKQGAYFGGSPRFWLNLQVAHDLALTERDSGKEIKRTVRTRAA